MGHPVQFTGGGRLMYRMTNPAAIKNTSLKRTIPHSHTGNRFVYVNEIANEPTNNLSAIGSRNDPTLLACEGQFLAM